ncbi:MAG TPA: hypothetical protein VFS43_08820 [Polyangiaceae bacterium]|nr:hypothetical protein [Polyangiaceae bacterium]
MAALCGLFGRPYLDLERYVDLGRLAALDDEICLGLTRVEPWYTGGSLKWMGVVAPSVQRDPYADYGRVIAAMGEDEFRRFCSLGEAPERFDPARRGEYAFGDETENPLTKEQMLYLNYKHGVYFPWKVVYHFVENRLWADKHSGRGKGFTGEARAVFPETVAFLRALPFREIGRCVLFGLEANDHAPLHRDAEPGRAEQVGHSISLCPRGDKRFYLSDPAESRRVPVTARAYWFNEMDYHGVEPDPYFRYSIRVDGVFEPSFLKTLRERHRQAP